MPHTFLCKHTFIFSMANQLFLNINGEVLQRREYPLKELAERWKSLDSRVSLEHLSNEFRRVSDRITDGKVKVHNNCRITFRNRIRRKESQEKNLPAIIEEQAMDESFY